MERKIKYKKCKGYIIEVKKNGVEVRYNCPIMFEVRGRTEHCPDCAIKNKRFSMNKATKKYQKRKKELSNE